MNGKSKDLLEQATARILAEQENIETVKVEDELEKETSAKQKPKLKSLEELMANKISLNILESQIKDLILIVFTEFALFVKKLFKQWQVKKMRIQKIIYLIEEKFEESLIQQKTIEERDDEIKTKDEIILQREQTLTNLQEEITEKTNRIAQLDKLFKGTAKIFSKQHNFVDHLKEKLKKEQTEKGISEEKSKHLQADIEQLDQQKQK
ncbi:2734_t:CDS:2 [Funneliformis geosporum]|uniref:2734_t:CDS:1 n=1 Tax=Funneliformis geosporum TaxID=1117311 RepID=A0A9W4T5X1_9GLOM|nr:2734_t:CDS:2 [Funneliformis geosporum]